MEYTTDFYIFSIITVLLLVITLIILYKSRSMVNKLFIITPILFSTILIFNIIEELGTNVSDFLLWFPYILAPLGILFAGWFIHYGYEITYQKRFIVFTSLYVIFSFISSTYLELATSGEAYVIAINHLVIVLPLLIASNEYLKLRSIVPDQKRKILALFIGLLIVVVGSLLRSLSFFLYEEDTVIGLVIIIVGTLTIMISFLLQTQSSKST
ncbi:MAG: hypothetical protein HeimC3_39140 [Candidatus Heimdallarchaeota archaeon LC_3]|nr:MAG: hypothetical protein HeimC3_39140 [Candidatus Heimdallarchaeota archaeon LC_3]